MGYDEESIKKSHELSDESVRGLSAIASLAVILIIWAGINSQIYESGVVVGRDDKALYVRSLQDTMKYNIFQNNGKLSYAHGQALPYIGTGDTLHYLKTNKNPVPFNSITRINGKTVDRFADAQYKIANGKRIRNALNQKTK